MLYYERADASAPHSVWGDAFASKAEFLFTLVASHWVRRFVSAVATTTHVSSLLARHTASSAKTVSVMCMRLRRLLYMSRTNGCLTLRIQCIPYKTSSSKGSHVLNTAPNFKCAIKYQTWMVQYLAQGNIQSTHT